MSMACPRFIAYVAAAAVTLPSAALAGERTYVDKDNGFSLTFPDTWSVETPSGSTIRLKTRSADNRLVCRVQLSAIDTGMAKDGENPKTVIESEWGVEQWKSMYEGVYSSFELTEEGLQRLSDGYPARGVDLDYQMGDPALAYGHSRVVMTADATRLATTSCDVMADSTEEVKRRWTANSEPAKSVPGTFLLLQSQ
jgi:hypothetical protein